MKKIEKITEERVLSMMIDIKDSIDNYNVIDYVKLQEKHKSTVNVIIATLREQQIFIRANNDYLWIGDSPTLSMAKIITKLYYQKSKNNQQRIKENMQKMALAKKHQESIEKTEKMLQEKQKQEELILDPLNFEVHLNGFKDLEKTPIHPHLMPIEDYQRLQIDSYIRQIENLQSEVEELKRLNENLKKSNSQIQSECSGMDTLIRDLKTQLRKNLEREAESGVEELKSEIKELKSEIDGKKILIKDMIAQIETFRNSNKKQEKELNILQEKKNIDAEDLQNKEFKIFNLENELSNLKKGKKPIRLFGIKIGSIG